MSDNHKEELKQLENLSLSINSSQANENQEKNQEQKQTQRFQKSLNPQNIDIQNQNQNSLIINSSDYDWEQMDNLGDDSFIQLEKNEKFSEKSFSIENICGGNKRNSFQNLNLQKSQNKSGSNISEFSILNLSQKIINCNSNSEIHFDQEQMSDFSKLLDELSQKNQEEKQNLDDSFDFSQHGEKTDKNQNKYFSVESSFQSQQQNPQKNRKESSFYIIQKISSQDFKWEELAKQNIEELSFQKNQEFIEVKIDVRKLFANNKRIEKKLTEKQKLIREKLRELCVLNFERQQKSIPKRIANNTQAQNYENFQKLGYFAVKNIEKKSDIEYISHKAHKILGDKYCKKYTKKRKTRDQEKNFVKIK